MFLSLLNAFAPKSDEHLISPYYQYITSESYI